MIKLSSRHSLVTTADGSVHSFDADALRHDLRRAFRTCGINEDWTADHVARIIEEHLASRPATLEPPMAEHDLHAMVLALLPAAGFADVGHAYAALVPQDARPADPDPFRPWNRTRIDAELRTRLPLGEAEYAEIAARTADALAALQLTQVRSELIHSLARHFLQCHAAAPPGKPDEPTWCLPPGAWPLAAVPQAQPLVRQGVLRPLPVSRFLPRVRLELDLRCLAATAGSAPLPELVFFPALARALDCVAGLLTQALGLVRAALPPNAPVPPRRLVTLGLEETVRDAILPQSPRARKALCHELRATIEAKLPQTGESPLLLDFR